MGGLYIYQAQGFWIANNFFLKFEGTITTANYFQSGAGITLDGGAGFSQFGTVINNKTYNTRYGITTRGKVSSVAFIQNDTNCSSSSTNATTLDASIGLDIGWMWYQNVASIASTGGENSVFGHQSNSCLIGFALGAQNGGATTPSNNSGGGHFYGKSENPDASCNIGSSSNHCSIGVSVLDSINNLISWQGKLQSTGWHFDGNSSGNVMLQPAFTGSLSSGSNGSGTLTSFCGLNTCTYTGSAYTNETNYVDASPSTARTTTAVLGQTFATTASSTFLNDQIPGALSFSAITAPTCASATYLFWADSAADRLKMCNNGTSSQVVASGVDISTSDEVTTTHISGATNSVIPKFSSGSLVNGSLTDNGVGATVGEGTAPGGVASSDLFYADSTAHRWKMNNNNTGAVQVVASGVDINTSDQVTSTHLSSPLPTAQGGTASTNGAVVVMTSGGFNATLSTSMTNYFPICGASSASTTEANTYCPVPASGTLSAIHVQMSGSPAASITFTVLYNGSSTGVSCTIGTGATSCDGTGSSSVSEGSGNTLNISGGIPSSSGARVYNIAIKITAAN